MKSSRRVAVITGASSGIGLAAAKSLAEQGWQVVLQGRDPARSAAAEAEVAAIAGDPGLVTMVRADLNLLREAARLADCVRELTGRIDALILNAGGVVAEEFVSDEGFEATLAGNHLSHFLLAQRLQPLLERTARIAGPGKVRVLTVSSRAHAGAGDIDWSNLNRSGHWDTIGSYSQAKLFNVLHARELARRLAPQGIVAHAMHPGIADTNFVSYGGEQMREHFARATLTSPADAAETLVWLATADEPGRCTGGYWFEKAPEQSTPLAQDANAAARLWTESEALISRAGY